MTYEFEVWTPTKPIHDNFKTTKRTYWSRCCKITILDRVRNEEIKKRINVASLLTENIKKKQLL